jgi:hypothetical protein
LFLERDSSLPYRFLPHTEVDLNDPVGRSYIIHVFRWRITASLPLKEKRPCPLLPPLPGPVA